MPFGGADDTSAASALPAALVEARRLSAAAQFRAAQGLASQVFPEARDARRWDEAAEAALLMARASGNLRDNVEALRWVHEAMQAATAADRPDLICASWIEAARAHSRDEDGALAQHAIDHVLALVPQLNRPEAIEVAYSGLTAVYSELGLTGLAVSCGRHALEHAELSGDIARICMARTNFLTIGAVHGVTAIIDRNDNLTHRKLPQLPSADRIFAIAVSMRRPASRLFLARSAA
jgi:tetratricopeptide (TPR) repeat protein